MYDYDEEKSNAIISKTEIEKYGWEQSGSLLNVSQRAVRPSHNDWSIHNPSPFLIKRK